MNMPEFPPSSPPNPYAFVPPRIGIGTPGAPAPPDPNFLTQALKARNVKRPFASLGAPAPMTSYAATLGPQVPPAMAGPEPIAPPPPEDPIAAATRRVQEALDAAKANTPYDAQETAFQAPERPKKSTATNIAEGLGMLFTHGQAGLNYAQGLSDERDRTEAQYAERYKEAQDTYTREVARQSTLAANSDAQQKHLDRNVDLAEREQKNVIDAKRYGDADEIAKQRADAYATSVSDRNVNAMSRNSREWASLQEKTRNDAAVLGERYRSLSVGLLRTRISTTAMLQGRGLSASVALQLGSQRTNLSLYEARLRDDTTRTNANNRIGLQAALARSRQLGAQYDTVIRAATNLGAPDDIKAAATRLLSPPAKLDDKGQPVLDSQGNAVAGGPSPYDAFIGTLSRIGVPSLPVADMDEVQNARQQAHESYMNGTYTPGYTPGSSVDVSAGINGNPGSENNALLSALVLSLAQGRGPNQGQGGGYGASPAAGGQGGGSISVPAQYQPLITHAASAAGVPADLYTRLLSSESHFDPNARGHYADGTESDALGMPQFITATGKDYGLNSDDDRRNPAKAIPAGAFYLRDNLRTFNGNEVLAVAAYNAGPQAVKNALAKAKGDPNLAIAFLSPETQGYVAKIMGGGAITTGGAAQGTPQGAASDQAAAEAAFAPKPVGRKGTAGKAPPVVKAAPGAQAATPAQIGKAVIGMYDTNHSGEPYDTAWADIKEKLGPTATPADLKAAEAALRPHANNSARAAEKARTQDDQERLVHMSNPSLSPERTRSIAQQRNVPEPPAAPRPAETPVSLARELVSRATSMGPMQPGDRTAIVNAITQKTGISTQQAERIVDAMIPHHRGVSGGDVRAVLGLGTSVPPGSRMPTMPSPQDALLLHNTVPPRTHMPSLREMLLPNAPRVSLPATSGGY